MLKKLFLIFAIFAAFCIITPITKAYVVENLNLPNMGDIIVGPGKTDVMLSPGANYTFEATISNVSGLTKIIDMATEDFVASGDPTQPAQFLGNGKSPYSLKDFIKPEIDRITLQTGQRLRLPVTISIPKDAEPGGLYGGLMISASNIDQNVNAPNGAAAGQVKIITRVALLILVRVKGDAVESGYLQNFYTDKNFYEKGPVNLRILSANTGNVHLDPYGTVEINDMFGRQIEKRDIDPWFVMPKSERIREIKWNSPWLFGRYTAVLSMNRGYANLIDTKTTSFWVIPWKIILIIVIGLILIVWFFVWVASHLEFRVKR